VLEKTKRKKDTNKAQSHDDDEEEEEAEVDKDKENDDGDMEIDDAGSQPATPKRRRQSSPADTPQSDSGSAVKRQRRPTRKLAIGEEPAPLASQITVSSARLDVFKTHLSTFIDRQPSVTTDEIFAYMKQHDSTFSEDEIRMALAKMQDDNQIMLAGEIVIRI
ncbi:unnamed protein product, partial [Rotaria magnacalcarata]